jgi:hypothetical protein
VYDVDALLGEFNGEALQSDIDHFHRRFEKFINA